ncbi:MAG: hypothetical protein IJI56_03040 [Firmicutes bacterium]|jgi:hypothetical protein|nr:hypothetical protein [Bacillota bacterium]
MKDMIVMIACIILGLFIFGLIAGDENSIKSVLKSNFEKGAFDRQYIYMVDEK